MYRNLPNWRLLGNTDDDVQPRVDPATSELILYHNTFVPPYVHYSIVPSTSKYWSKRDDQKFPVVFNAPIPGIKSAKMMHDFGASRTQTVIMDLPLSLDPLNLMKNKPVVAYDPNGRSRFGVFPRYRPDMVRWFETKSCCIFHTANSWDSTAVASDVPVVNMLVCRLTSASLVFSAGDIAAPIPTAPLSSDDQEVEQCRLYFYQFVLSSSLINDEERCAVQKNIIMHQWALSAIPFEFPSLRDSVSMSAAKYIYGCSVANATFGAALGRAVKINSLVKFDVETLIRRGIENPPAQVHGCVDTRNLADVMASSDPLDTIKVFMMPPGWYAQEPRFVPRQDGIDEDDGWLLSYVFDESQLDSTGECRVGAQSELWIIEAKNMKNVVARVYLPQRVPYGLHGNWFPEEQVQNQRPVQHLRNLPRMHGNFEAGSYGWKVWMNLRKRLEEVLA